MVRATQLLVALAIASVGAPALAQAPAPSPGYTPQQNCESGNLTVQGNGVAYATADQAFVDLTISVTADTAGAARDQAATRAEDVYMQLQKIRGLSADNITTTSINVSPEYSFNDTTNEHYTFQNGVEVAVGNLSSALLAAVLDAAVSAGGDNLTIESVTFSLSDELSHAKTVEARRQASQDALATAQQYSSNFGVGLGRVLSIFDTTPAATPVQSQSTQTRTYSAAAGNAGGGSNSTPVSIGKQPVTVSVQASFGIC